VPSTPEDRASPPTPARPPGATAAARPPGVTAAARPPGVTAAARLTEALRDAILRGELAPGAALREEGLAERHGVSRHTVRTALAALAAERLVRAVPYAGVRVTALDEAELIALQQLRAALETEAVRLLTETHGTRWTDAVLDPMREAVERLAAAEEAGDWIATTRAHARVHRAVVDAAGSPRISEAYAQLETELLLLLLHVRPQYGASGLGEEHRRYLDALGDRGGEAVRAHLARSTRLILDARRGVDG